MDRPTGRVIRRYERERPGELIHVDVKKRGRIPGGGWRVLGRTRRDRQLPPTLRFRAQGSGTRRARTVGEGSRVTPRQSRTTTRARPATLGGGVRPGLGAQHCNHHTMRPQAGPFCPGEVDTQEFEAAVHSYRGGFDDATAFANVLLELSSLRVIERIYSPSLKGRCLISAQSSKVITLPSRLCCSPFKNRFGTPFERRR